MKNSNSNLENKSPEATKETFYKSTSMWKSTYNNSNENSGIQNPNPSKRPEWSENKPAFENKRRVAEPFYSSLYCKY